MKKGCNILMKLLLLNKCKNSKIFAIEFIYFLEFCSSILFRSSKGVYQLLINIAYVLYTCVFHSLVVCFLQKFVCSFSQRKNNFFILIDNFLKFNKKFLLITRQQRQLFNSILNMFNRFFLNFEIFFLRNMYLKFQFVIFYTSKKHS